MQKKLDFSCSIEKWKKQHYFIFDHELALSFFRCFVILKRSVFGIIIFLFYNFQITDIEKLEPHLQEMSVLTVCSHTHFLMTFKFSMVFDMLEVLFLILENLKSTTIIQLKYETACLNTFLTYLLIKMGSRLRQGNHTNNIRYLSMYNNQPPLLK